MQVGGGVNGWLICVQQPRSKRNTGSEYMRLAGGSGWCVDLYYVVDLSAKRAACTARSLADRSSCTLREQETPVSIPPCDDRRHQ